MILFKEVTKIYAPERPAVDNVSFGVEPGEFTSLVGKSGSGKTTLLKLFLREEFPTAGQVMFGEQNVHEIPDVRLPEFRRKVGMVFQDYKLLQYKTAYENVAYVMEVMGAKEEDIERDVMEVLDIVGLEDQAEQYPYQLSGGEKQRVAIARSLIHRPDIIIADEPTGNLDPYHTKDIVALLVKINELGTTVILATHNKDVINKLGKRVLTLEDGKLIRDEKRGRFML
ncbi:MAG: cell division ATP-binding protein FtsE [Candidatus Wildermuthbacteria bacterium]|nr:cell division ATP-binding protein FtsE [Candidatus Wildermuthbacteria bacterium]